MDKKQVRQQMKTKRANLSRKAVLDYSNAIWDKIYPMEIYKNATTILLYSSIGNEVSTTQFAKAALASGKKIAYPVTNMEDNTMEFHVVSNLSELGPVKSGSFNLSEPKPDPSTKVIPGKHTLMIVPGLAFDQKLYRTGYGGGFYDKYIKQYPDMNTLGVCYHFQLVPSLPTKGYDQPVGAVIHNA